MSLGPPAPKLCASARVGWTRAIPLRTRLIPHRDDDDSTGSNGLPQLDEFPSQGAPAAAGCTATGTLVLSDGGKAMILSFRDAATEAVFNGRRARNVPPAVVARARRKLDLLNAAITVEDLRVPPGNQLEALYGDRKGQHSIRINDQWRICFRFSEANAYDVEIVDYH